MQISKGQLKALKHMGKKVLSAFLKQETIHTNAF